MCYSLLCNGIQAKLGALIIYSPVDFATDRLAFSIFFIVVIDVHQIAT